MKNRCVPRAACASVPPKKLRGTQRAARSLRGIVLGGGVVLSACTSLVRQTARAASAGMALAPTEQRIRDALADGKFDLALRAASSEKRGGPGDGLLRELYAGTAAYYAGKWAESATALDHAAIMAEDRYTRSASRGALALTTSDLALPYVPGHNERLLVHYYALLAWLRRGSVPDAAVEARRIGFLLQQYEDRRTPLDASARAALRVVSAAVFAAAGEQNDAAVALRNARALVSHAPLADDETPDAEPDAPWLGPVNAPNADSGDVLVVVEQGFVAHRVEQRLTVRARDDDEWRVFVGAGQRESARGEALSHAASLLTGDAFLWADAPSAELALDRAGGAAADSVDDDPAPDDTTRATSGARASDARASDDTVLGASRRRRRASTTRMQLAWPALRRPIPQPVAALVVDSLAPLSLLRADLSAAEAADFGRDRAARLARLLVRAGLRQAAASGLEKKHKDVASVLRAVGGAVDRADTRSWHLLPGVVSVARVRLPAGDHALVAQVGGERVSLGTVHVAPGGLALATTRVWRRGVEPALTSATPAAP